MRKTHPLPGIRILIRILIATTSLFVCLQSVFGQDRCLSADDVKKMLAQMNSPQNVSLNQKLRGELLKLREKDQRRFQDTLEETEKTGTVMKRMNESRYKNTAALCPILKEFGWPTAAMVGQEGVTAAFILLKNSSSYELQTDLLPVIIAAVKKGEIPRADFAGYIDRLRLSAGLKQLFGTQATITDGLIVLYPIETEANVEARRKQYELPPLAEYLKALERIYRKPLVKSPGKLTNQFADSLKQSIARTTADSLFEGQAVGEGELIRVETNLVSLNVSVYSQKLKTHISTLEQKDFAVSEDGRDETITFFATTDVPFDLVLLIDLSGSTAGKRDLIRKTTRRFIEAARPFDRLAIVTFSTNTEVVSPLTIDHAKLLESANKIDGKGGSNVWDALKFTLDQVVGPKTLERRRAIVFMTDGVDNALVGFGGGGSEISFADLLEAVRRNDTLVIPIYLDTESDGTAIGWPRTIFENARRTLALLAEESGGLYYKARKIEDLDGVYAQVIEDLGKVYSLGYRPTNENRDGSWRMVKIQIPNRPDLLTRARPGYYAN
jgi:VWFA-related protein